MVTIKQVAARAGISFKTVSRVINNEPNVKPETRNKVEKAIAELGYRPNSAARMMRNAKSGVIGFISDEVSTTSASIEIIKGAQELAWQHSKLLMVLNIKPDDDSVKKAIEQLLQFRAEGVIYASMYHKPVSLPKDLHNLPTVLVNCFSPTQRIASVVPDDYLAAYDLTTRMIKKGARRIALLNLNKRIIAAAERQKGYFDAHYAAGIQIDDVYARNAVIEENGQERYITENVLDELLALPEPPDAIVCGKDQLAMQVYFYLAQKGIVVGKDIAIGSFDNMDPIPQTLKPGLSTMALPHLDMGKWGLQYILEGQTHTEQVKLPCTFIERQSF
ncbi:LacI family DNA-binding transcriptional regulator [Vibrio viridaestus]|uniref:LacI family DNA-binding transcriptional regulator n=2 Tax=Vibrio viridaestus TaxID=2487322 RepID=A0A3N9TEI8_9VIBR|nr:LacI family DNA-binding transcriptional regulator [Vibrio viridaestus]